MRVNHNRLYTIKTKKRRNCTSQRKRSKEFCLNANDQTKITELEDTIYVIAASLCNEEDSLKVDRMKEVLKVLAVLHLDMTLYEDRPLNKLERTVNSIQQFKNRNDEEYCRSMFCFESDELERLHRLLQFPVTVHFSNRGVMPGEEVFLRGLYELTTGENKNSICKNVFGRHPSDQSRAYSYFINHIYANYKHLLFDNLDWWFRGGYLQESVNAIECKMSK